MSSNEENETTRLLEINTGIIELYKVLKLEGLTGSGGSAKLLIADGQVSVNGNVETRKRKKIVPGDIVKFGDELIEIQQKRK